ncbi:MAG: flavin reductase family protein [Candidatus Thorarchaeota archaeon]
MTKIEKGPRTSVYPLPAALVSAFDKNGKPNALAAAWVSNICFEPPTAVVGIRDSRYSFELIESAGCYGINIPSVDIVKKVDYFGMVSGRDHNKFEETGLTVFEGKYVKVPLIEECPINIECKVTQIVKIGSHSAFFGEILNVYYDESMMDEKGLPDLLLGDIIAYGGGKYYRLKEVVGKQGFSKKD